MSDDVAEVGIIGPDGVARALARRSGKRGAVRWWSPVPLDVPAGEPPLPASVEVVPDLAAAARCEVLFLCVRAPTARELLGRLGAHVQGDQLLVHTARGLEAATGRGVSSIAREETCLRKVGALGGALSPHALDRDRPGALVVASRFDEVSAHTARLLEGPCLRVLSSRDLIGVELAGAYRSLCALWIGVIDGLDLGYSARALMVAESLREAAALAVRLGADPLTFTGHAAVGDLCATAADPDGEEHAAGLRLAREAARPDPRTDEAVATARGACALAAELGAAAPVAAALCRVLDQAAEPLAVLRQLFESGAEARP